MIYRLAVNEDLDQMMAMVDQAKASFKARGIDQWQKGEPDREGLAAGAAKGQIRVLEEDGRVIGMITLLEGRDPSYAKIDGAWLNDRPYVGFHRDVYKRQASDKMQRHGPVHGSCVHIHKPQSPGHLLRDCALSGPSRAVDCDIEMLHCL